MTQQETGGIQNFLKGLGVKLLISIYFDTNCKIKTALP